MDKAKNHVDNRQRLIDKAVKAGLVAKALSIAASLATVPLVMSALGLSDFSVWAAITSLLTMMLFLDFGIGNSAMGRIAHALAKNENVEAMELIRHSYVVLLGISMVLLLVIFLVRYSGFLEMIALKTGSFLGNHIDLVANFLMCYTLVIPSTFVQRLLFSHQEAGTATALQFAFSVIYMGFAALMAWLVPDLEVFVLGYVLLMFLIYGGYSLYFLKKNYPNLRVRGGIDCRIISSLLKGAGLFFLLQITVAAVYNSDILILTAVVTPDDVATYATTWRVFSLVVVANGLILSPLWPAVTDANAKSDWVWIKKAYYHHLKRSMAASFVLSTLLIVVGNVLLLYWTGGRIQAPLALMFLFGLWVILEGYGQCMAMLLNGLNVLRLQLVVAVLLLVVGTALKVYLADSIGFYGPILATCFSFVIIVCIAETVFIYNMLERKL